MTDKLYTQRHYWLHLVAILRLVSTHLVVQFILYWTLSHRWVMLNLFDVKYNIINNTYLWHKKWSTLRNVAYYLLWESSSWNWSLKKAVAETSFLFFIYMSINLHFTSRRRIDKKTQTNKITRSPYTNIV